MNMLDDDQFLDELAASLVMNETLKEHGVSLMVHLYHHSVYDQVRVQRMLEKLESQGVVIEFKTEVYEEPMVLELISPELPDIILEDPKGNQPYFRRFEKGRFKGGR